MRPRVAHPPSAIHRSHVVIVGGGVGGLEALLALAAVAGDRVALTLITPDADFVYRPVAVLEPFVGIPPRRIPVADVAGQARAHLLHDTVVAVDPIQRTLTTGDGAVIAYDACVIAVGARAVPAPGVTTIDLAAPASSLGLVRHAIESGAVSSVAFTIGHPTWPLPAYELALLTRDAARAAGRAPALALHSDEPRPLAALGAEMSARVAGLLLDADIAFNPTDGVTADCTLAVPGLRAAPIGGLPLDGDGFIPVGIDAAVKGLADVYAVGDATDFALKFGGVAALQADAAAQAIAAVLGAVSEPVPCEGLIAGVMLTGGNPSELPFVIAMQRGAISEVTIGALGGRWSDDAKLGARYLGAYLDQRWAHGPVWHRASG